MKKGFNFEHEKVESMDPRKWTRSVESNKKFQCDGSSEEYNLNQRTSKNDVLNDCQTIAFVKRSPIHIYE